MRIDHLVATSLQQILKSPAWLQLCHQLGNFGVVPRQDTFELFTIALGCDFEVTFDKFHGLPHQFLIILCDDCFTASFDSDALRRPVLEELIQILV